MTLCWSWSAYSLRICGLFQRKKKRDDKQRAKKCEFYSHTVWAVKMTASWLDYATLLMVSSNEGIYGGHIRSWKSTFRECSQVGAYYAPTRPGLATSAMNDLLVVKWQTISSRIMISYLRDWKYLTGKLCRWRLLSRCIFSGHISSDVAFSKIRKLALLRIYIQKKITKTTKHFAWMGSVVTPAKEWYIGSSIHQNSDIGKHPHLVAGCGSAS